MGITPASKERFRLDFQRSITISSKSITSEAAMATTVTQKGQVTIPKPIRDHLGIKPGSKVEFRRAADGSVVFERADGQKSPSRFADLVGSAGPGLSTDEIMAMTRGE
jgi:AbrB family looped-hinge helix DNA binding protein